MTEESREQTPMAVSAEERGKMIAVAAYYLAEQRGFSADGAIDDWLEAEQRIDRLLEAMRGRGISRSQFERAGLRNALQLWDAEPGN